MKEWQIEYSRVLPFVENHADIIVSWETYAGHGLVTIT